jgi:hypothetical protein
MFHLASSEASSVPSPRVWQCLPIFIVVPWLVVQMVLTGFGTTRKKGGPKEPPALPFAAIPQKHAYTARDSGYRPLLIINSLR